MSTTEREREESSRMLGILRRHVGWLLFAVLLGAFVIHTRLKFQSPYLFSWDSVQFALSLEHFDVRRHQPHPPGYPLYSLTLRGLNSLTGDPNETMIALNIAATLATCVLLWLLVGELYRPDPPEPVRRFAASAGAALLYAVNGVVWLYGCVAEIYAVEGFFAALVLYLLVLSSRRPAWLFWAAACLAVAGGFRPTTEAFLFPVYLAYLFGRNRRQVWFSVLLLVFLNLLWAVPLMELSGGPLRYVRLLLRQTESAVAGGAEEASLPRWTILFRLIQAAGILPLIVLSVRIRRWRIPRNDLLLAAFVVPPLLFFFFGHYPKDGYLLLILPAIIALVCAQLGRTCNTALMIVILTMTAFVHHRFFVDPMMYPAEETDASLAKQIAFEISWPNRHVIAAHTVRLQAFMDKMAAQEPGRKLFVARSFYFPDWRTLMYYYPDDIAVRLLENGNAYVAHHHEFEVVRDPVNLPPGFRLLVYIAPDTPEIPMRTASYYEYQYSFATRKDLPDDFRLGGFAFHKVRQ